MNYFWDLLDGAPGASNPLRLHRVFNTADIYGDGKPTRIAHSTRNLRQPVGSLPVTEGISARTYFIPAFKRYCPALINSTLTRAGRWPAIIPNF